MNRFKLLLISLLLGCANAHAQSGNFETGLSKYESKDYAAAVQSFEAAIGEKETAAARHNLALSYYQVERKAESAWQLERAMRLDPFNTEYRYKMEALREDLGLLPKKPNWYSLSAQALSLTQWVLVGSLSAWAIVISLVIPICNASKPGLPLKSVRVVSITLLLLCLPFTFFHLRSNQKGIVLADSLATLHAAPAGASPQTGSARPGERGRVLDTHGDYLRIETEGKATGWLHKDAFRKLILPHTDA